MSNQERARELVSAAHRLAGEFAQGAARRDARRELPQAEIETLARHGILAARVPREFGGIDLCLAELSDIFVVLGKADPNIAQAIQPHACGVEKIRLYGTPEQKRRYFALLLEGAMITNASAEKGGATVGEIRVMLSRQAAAGGWRLDGDKHYCTGSLFASHFYSLVRRDDGGRSIALLPRQRQGVSVIDDWDGMGQRTTASGTVRFEGVHIADDEHMPLPPSGTLRTHEGAFAQVLHAAIDVGIALAAFEDAARYGSQRARPVPEAGVARAGDDPYVQQAVGEMAMLAHGAQALLERAARSLDAILPAALAGSATEQELGGVSIAVAEAKMAANDAALRVSEMLYRVGGASATSRSLNLDRHWRNARTHTTHDPVAYKAKAVGDYYLNGNLPPITSKI
ncbi:acyl-CoA dehydrogenase family protein [Herbaspirillum sp. YR522]|uniref:acyl-CoA dehydrogenase family protein n=1 Tax=Herbaspirillum sp. YR522 TaxID=1144342 RepID=UPI00026F9098|nr:acyl-CoA dehydrogenase family protein [Herbaspirillum sp. YR522]EJN09828.1 acyl-CoA dehydrogenase [Herbaspirillum sp. YR522]